MTTPDRSLQVGRTLVMALRQRIMVETGMGLTRRDVAWVFTYTDQIAPMDWDLLDTLKGCKSAATGVPSMLAGILAREDGSDTINLTLDTGETDEPADTVAAGIYARLNATAHGHDVTVEREALRIRLHDPDGTVCGRNMLLRVLADIHSLLT